MSPNPTERLPKTLHFAGQLASRRGDSNPGPLHYEGTPRGQTGGRQTALRAVRHAIPAAVPQTLAFGAWEIEMRPIPPRA
jgi:hypothetical protein